MWVCCVWNGINSAPTRVCCVWNGMNSAPTSILRKDIANERNANLFPCRGVIYHVLSPTCSSFPMRNGNRVVELAKKIRPYGDLHTIFNCFAMIVNRFLHSITHYYTHDTPILT